MGWRIEIIISTSGGNRNGDGKMYHKSDEKMTKKSNWHWKGDHKCEVWKIKIEEEG